jgi:hypothetical protein
MKKNSSKPGLANSKRSFSLSNVKVLKKYKSKAVDKNNMLRTMTRLMIRLTRVASLIAIKVRSKYLKQTWN